MSAHAQNQVQVTVQQKYQQILRSVAQQPSAHNLKQAAQQMQQIANTATKQPIWQARMQTASILLAMREQQAIRPAVISSQTLPKQYALLVNNFIQNNPAPESSPSWLAGSVSVLLPGAGHALLKRWHDAITAFVLVFPMLLLTCWAAKRKMGPVTVFFALITIWLWSGVIFSAVSLAERMALESYILWWQSCWQASALPGRPW
ncbi:MAG: hypothetical protein R8K21_07410 [Mariprofundales bacterium]